jgi:dihydrofolate reductase
MRKIMLMSSVSLDGFFEGPDRDISWHLVNEEFLRYLNEQFRAMGAFMYGRVTYELMADIWPPALIRTSRRPWSSSPGSGATCLSSYFRGPLRRRAGTPR